MKNLIQGLLLKLLCRLPGSLLVKMSGGTPIEIGGRKLDPMLQVMWVQGKKEKSLIDMEPPEARRAMEDGLKLTQGPRAPLEKVTDRTIPGPAGEIPIRVYQPPGHPEKLPVVLYFHQGGCVIGSMDTCDSFCSRIAAGAGCVVVSVDYRLAPDHKFPSAAEDAIAAYEWAIANGQELGGDPKEVSVAGDSAGGMLSAVIAQHAKREKIQSPRAQILIYPWLTPEPGTKSYELFAEAYPLNAPMMGWFADHYLNSDEEKSDWRVNPLGAEDLSGLPPALIATAGFDPLCDEGAEYAEKLTAAGVDVEYKCYESLTHAFTALGGAVPAARSAIDEIVAGIKSRI